MITGSITSKDVLLNAATIVRSFGLSTYARCLRAMLTGRRTTFLELAWRADLLHSIALRGLHRG